jgi:1,4-alpha-glucan branching enzyme
MLFMGEEWNATQPFPYFCDYEGGLADAIRRGRREEFAHLPEFFESEPHPSIPDPLSEDTFRSAILRWEERDQAQHAGWFAWYRRILAVRHAAIVPRLSNLHGGDCAYVIYGPHAVSIQWLCSDGAVLGLNANLSARAQAGFAAAKGRVIWLEGRRAGGVLQPWTVEWSVWDA